MPKISTFMYAEGAAQIQTSPNESKLQISAPLQVLPLLYVPGTFSFSVVVGIIDLDLSVTHQMQIRFKRSEDEKIVIDTNPMAIPPANADKLNELPTNLQGFIFSMGLQNVNFETEGEYVTEVMVDGEALGGFSINVVKRANKNG